MRRMQQTVSGPPVVSTAVTQSAAHPARCAQLPHPSEGGTLAVPGGGQDLPMQLIVPGQDLERAQVAS